MDQEKHPIDPALTKLCARCSVIRIDDRMLQKFDEVEDLRLLSPFDTHQIRLPYKVTDRSPNLPILREGAKKGCGFCEILLQQITAAALPGTHEYVCIRLRYFSYWRIESIDDYYRGSGRKVLGGMSIELWGLDHDDLEPAEILGMEETARLYFMAESDSDVVRVRLGVPKPLKDEILCEENVQFMRDALEKCTSSCNHPIFKNHLPKRLLDISTRSDSQGIRLVESHTLCGYGHRPSYAALSYCWGNEDDARAQFQTNRASYDARRAGIELHQLSQVQLDAIRVCRLLDFQYLWVDSLCIIQGDTTDWEEESASMAETYNNAAVTIIAAQSSSCHESFLRRRRVRVQLSIDSLIPDNCGTYSLVPTTFTGDSREPVLMAISDLSMSKWITRGWTLQEKVISRSQLIFGENMIHFACTTAAVSENGRDERVNPGRRPRLEDLILKPEGLKYDTHTIWNDILFEYCSREFTAVQDRLAALSSLAELFARLHEEPSSSYLAGLWKTTLPHSLLWASQKVAYIYPIATEGVTLRSLATKVSSPLHYLAPTWSSLRWGTQPLEKVHLSRATGGKKEPCHATCMYNWSTFYANHRWSFMSKCIEIEAHIETEGGNPFWRVREGVLRLKAHFGTAPFHLSRCECHVAMWKWAFTHNSKRIAYCTFDSLLDHSTGLPERGMSRDGLKMLVLGSYWSQSSWLQRARDYMGERCATCNDPGTPTAENLDSSDVGGCSDTPGEGLPRQDSDTQLQSCEPCGGVVGDDDGAGTSEAPGTSSDQPGSGKRKEDLWGLLLYSSQKEGQEDKYVRIGLWGSSGYDRGDTDFFDKLEVQDVEIV